MSVPAGSSCPLPRHLLATAISAASLAWITPGWASPGWASPGWASPGRTSELPETSNHREPPITVTGERRADSDFMKFTAPLVDTPKSVTVVSSRLIEEQGARSLVDALRNVPGITFNAGEGGQPAGDNLKIRGFDAGADVFIDGIRDAGSQVRDVFALEQIEVIKGTSSAYSGRGAGGGVVNLVTKHAQADDFFSGTVGGGSDDYLRATVDGNYRLGDSSALRLNLIYHDADVPGRDAVDLEHRGALGALALGIGTPWRADFDYYVYRTDDMPDYSFPYGRDADNAAPEGAPVVADRNNFYGLSDRDYQKTGADVGTLRIEHDFNDSLTLRNTTRIGRTTNDYIVTNPDDGRANVPNGFVLRNAKSRDSETRTVGNQTELVSEFSTGGMGHSIATGIEYLRETMFNQNYSVSSGNFAANAQSDPATSCSAPGAVGAASEYNCTTLGNPDPSDPWTGTISRSSSFTDVEATTWSVYLFDTLTLSDRWIVNGGIRYDDFDVDQRSASDDLHSSDGFWNYQLGVVFKPAANSSIYLSAGTASTPPGNTLGDGTENLASNNVGLEPERSRSIELGTKWLLMDDHISMTAALFRTEKNNASVALESGRGAPRDTIGKQHVDGFELSVSGSLTDSWELLASYTFLDSRIDDAGPASDDAGNAFPNTPRDSASFWTTYALSPRLNVGAGANYVGQRYGDTANTVWVPAYWRYDAMAAFRASDGVNIQLNVQNLTDKVYFDRPYAAHYGAVGAARNATLTVTFEL